MSATVPSLPGPSLTQPSPLAPRSRTELQQYAAHGQGVARQLNSAITAPWTSMPIHAASFRGLGTMVWTVPVTKGLGAGGGANSVYYLLRGSTLDLDFDLEGTSVSGGAIGLLMTLPQGLTAARQTRQLCWALDNLSGLVAFAQTTSASPTLTFYRNDLAAWAASTASTYLLGSIRLEVR